MWKALPSLIEQKVKIEEKIDLAHPFIDPSALKRKNTM